MSKSFIDVHSHPLFPAFVQALNKGNASDSGDIVGIPKPQWSVEEHLRVMDEHGIDTAMLSLPDIADSTAKGEGCKLARELNEQLAAIVAQHPNRFGAFAAVPMGDMDAALEEMTHALDVLKLDGVFADTHYQGKYLGEPDYDPWFEEMDRRGVTLFVHPATPPSFDQANKLNVSVIDFMFETTHMITNMVLSGAKGRFSKIKIIATHGGGTIPFLAHRISLAGPMPWAYKGGPKMNSEQITASLKTFYLDLTAAADQNSLDTILQLIPADQLVFGFDFPLMPKQTISPAIESFASYPALDQDEKQRIVRENAAKLFPRLQ